MNAPTRINSALDVRGQFPAIVGWHYLDSAATAQKPQAVIDAITQAYSRDYATVHRGVYERSASMTASYEAARAAASNLIGGKPNELIFTRGATEAINLVARSLPKNGRNRVLVSQLEHHSNIVPWQLAGYELDAVPLTADGKIDLDVAEAMLTEEHRVVAFAHVSNVLGSVLDAKRAADIARSKGALLLLDGCQAAPRMSVNVAEIGADFYAFSAHKLYGPTGIGCLWGRAQLLAQLPPWQGGGAMIEKVTFEETTFLDPPARFEAGTPHIVGAVGLHAAVDWTQKLTLDAIHANPVSPHRFGQIHRRRRHAKVRRSDLEIIADDSIGHLVIAPAADAMDELIGDAEADEHCQHEPPRGETKLIPPQPVAQ